MTPDTIKVITDTVSHTLKYQIANSVPAIGWVVLSLGLLMYWMKNLVTLRKETKAFGATTLKDFFSQNIFEIPMSLISVLAIAILAPYIPADLIDTHGILSLFLIGFSGGSIISGLTSLGKQPLTTEQKASPKPN